MANRTAEVRKTMLPPIPWRSAISGTIWVYCGYLLGKLSVFATTAILARILSVEDFGLVAYAVMVVTLVDVVKDLGVGSALIAYSGDGNVQTVRSTAFAITTTTGLLLSVVTVALAPAVGAFFGEAEASGLTQVMALALAIASLGRTHDALLQKEMSFGKKLLPDLGQSACKSVVSIGLALAGFGAWSIAWGQVAGAVATVALSWVVFPWRPSFVMSARIARGLASFGGQIMAVNIITAILLNADYIVVGRVLGTEALGLYTLAFKLPDLLLINLCWVLSRVMFPLFARLTEDKARLLEAYLSTFRYVSLVTIPIGLGIVATAPSLVDVLFGSAWRASVPTMQVLAIYSTLHALFFHGGDVLKALGRGSDLVRFSLTSAIVLLPAMLGGAIWLGLVGVAIAWIVGDSTRLVLKVRALQREIGLKPRELLGTLRAPVLAGAVMFAVVSATGSLRGQPGIDLLVAQVVIGAVVYLTALGVISPALAAEVRAAVRRISPRQVDSAATRR